MDTTFGVLCLIPPIVAIVLALVTRETILSLFVAVWLGSTMINGYNPLVGFVHIVSDYIIPSLSGHRALPDAGHYHAPCYRHCAGFSGQVVLHFGLYGL